MVRAPDFESGSRVFESRSDHFAGVVSWYNPSSTPRPLPPAREGKVIAMKYKLVRLLR